MQNNNKKFPEQLISKTKIYLILIFILLLIISIENKKWIIPAIIIYVIIVSYAILTDKKKKSEISETIQDLKLTVDTAAKTSLINSPFPLVIIEENGKIVWRSSKFVSEFANIDINNYIQDILYDLIDTFLIYPSLVTITI